MLATVTCQRCGNKFERKPKDTRSKHCPDCRPIVQQEYVRRWQENHMQNPERLRNCVRCGTPINWNGSYQKYCQACSRTLAIDRARKRAKAGRAAGPRERHCADCGTTISKAAIRCTDCSRKRLAQQKRAWYQENGKAYLDAYDSRELENPIDSYPVGSYTAHPRQFDLLIAAIAGQAYRDSRQEYQDGEYVDATVRGQARLWWNENGRDWLDILGIDIELPEVSDAEDLPTTQPLPVSARGDGDNSRVRWGDR